jgi:SAM-dependent methyltransferase
MKSKKRVKISSDLDTLMPELIQAWRRFIKIQGPDDVLQTREFRGVCDEIIKLEEAYKAKKTPEYTREAIAASILYYFPLHYAQGFSLISELPQVPQRVVEIGSGPAPFALAALKHGAIEAFALDQNEDVLRLGAEVVGRHGYPIAMRKWSYPKNPFPVEGEIDLIILSYCLDEFFQNSKDTQNAFINDCLKRLVPTGHLLIVDRSELSHNERILALRDKFVQQGIAVQAPCVWKGECPALKSKSLCFAQREFEKPFLIKEIQRKTDIFLSSLKMSYLILKSPKAAWPESPNPCYRVISPPIDSPNGEKRYYLCGTIGKKQIFEERDEKLYLQRGALITLGSDNPENSDSKVKIVLAPGQALK